MSWRYHPVIETDEAGEQMSLCRFFFDEKGELSAWAATAGAVPWGENLEGLNKDLTWMMTAALFWKPVRFEDIRVGMRLEPAVTMEQREDIADMIESLKGSALASARKVN